MVNAIALNLYWAIYITCTINFFSQPHHKVPRPIITVELAGRLAGWEIKNTITLFLDQNRFDGGLPPLLHSYALRRTPSSEWNQIWGFKIAFLIRTIEKCLQKNHLFVHSNHFRLRCLPFEFISFKGIEKSII